MMHELFHRVQDELGFPAANPANAHLDEMAGRLWLRLELEALRAALGSEGEEQTGHIRNALVFRARRHGLFDGAAVKEAALERNEGLAEYTGPIYGILLDSRGPGWRKQITSRIGLGDLLARQCGITLPANLAQEAEKLLPLYGARRFARSRPKGSGCGRNNSPHTASCWLKAQCW